MIAYKLFYVHKEEFDSGTMSYSLFPYTKNCVWLRPDGWGPFACFASTRDALRFKNGFGWRNASLYKVRIKVSKDTRLWFRNKRGEFYENAYPPEETIFADEFEILEEVK